jgi:competence protein ComEC
MKRCFTGTAAAVILALAASGAALAQNNPAPNAQSGKLSMYWIDTEGGAATLIVSPSGESSLIDTGFPNGDRDAKRIFAAAQQAGLNYIDHLVISHWHGDHEGGLAAFSKMMPISKFYDHSDTASPEDQVRLDDYKAVAGSKRVIVKPGGKIPMKDLDVLVVTSDQKLLANPVNGGGPNPLCANAPRLAPAAPENLRTVGLLLSIAPQVIIVNNGPRKGLGQTDNRAKPIEDPQAAPYERNSYLRMAKLPGIEGIWQQHLSLVDKDPNHNTSENMIANFEETAECKGNWIGASVAQDGKFTVTNGRNGFSKSYVAR